MKNVRTTTVRLTDLADRLGYEVSPSVWTFIARRIAGREIRWDAGKGTLTYPDYIPVDQMVSDVLDEMADGRIEVRTCGACEDAFDVNREDGIFGDSENLARFICHDCADRMSAREFHDRFLRP